MIVWPCYVRLDIHEHDSTKQDRDLYQAGCPGKHADSEEQSANEVRKGYVVSDQYDNKRIERECGGHVGHQRAGVAEKVNALIKEKNA